MKKHMLDFVNMNALKILIVLNNLHKIPIHVNILNIDSFKNGNSYTSK